MDGSATRMTVVVPTYREAENIPLLVRRLEAVRDAQGWELDVLFMDDDSRDGSAETVEKLNLPWVRLVTRTTDRGLSTAVLDGLRRAGGELLVVMDADLSHPPETLPAMLECLNGGADFVIGSRFIKGGTTDDDWGLFRWLNSRVATMLAYPLTTVKDPMSGFFMLRRQTFEQGKDYNPIGYKIGLELLVKCGCRHAEEVPIHFADRQLGVSKLTLAEQFRYLQHIRRLYIHRFELIASLAQFLLVGASGLGVNLALLTALLSASIPTRVSIVLAIALSMLWNFFLNRRLSFSYARDRSVLKQLWGFVTACSAGAAVNYLVAIWALPMVKYPQLAAAIGVASGTGFNFLASRLWVFKRSHVVTKASAEHVGTSRGA